MPVGAPFSAPETEDAFAVAPAVAMGWPLPVWVVIWPAPAAVVAADAWVPGTMAGPLPVWVVIWLASDAVVAADVWVPGAMA